MAQKKTYNVGDIVGKNIQGDKSIGRVEENTATDEYGNIVYNVYFYTEPTGLVGMSADELIFKPGSKQAAINLNVAPSGGSRKSRRSRKNKRTRRVRR
jgi:hypothetical protein